MQQRFTLINEVVGPCAWERKQIADPAARWPHRYQYDKQLFAVRLKEFWPLHKLPHVQRAVVPQLKHEVDGLILQVREHETLPFVVLVSA